MAPPFATPREGQPVSKDKHKKDKKDKKDKKKHSGTSLAKASKKATKSLQAITHNPLVADVVAAALVAMASALKDSEKAKRLASDAGDQLNALSKKTANQGNVMWDLALDIGRRTLETLASEESAKGNRSR
jgi:hypothetical protein